MSVDETPSGRPSILLVEDNPDHVWMMRSTIDKTEKFELVIARTAREAREAIARQKFDAVVTDQRLPDAEGIHLIRELREAGYEGTIILVTAQATEEMADEGLEAGADDYVFKARGYPDRVLEELMERLQGDE